MLVSFTVENWRCFRDRQQFSMAAPRGTDAFSFETDVRRHPRLNRVAAIYGPNGSGKTWLVRALGFLRAQMTNPNANRITTGLAPFLFDANTAHEPTSFEIVFIRNHVVYEYGFAVDSRRVWEEWLSVCPPDGRSQRWLHRQFSPHANDYQWKFSRLMHGRSTWRRDTRPDALFVPTAISLGSESLRPIADWFGSLLVINDEGASLNLTGLFLEEGELTKRLMQFLGQVDIAVEDIVQRQQEIPVRLARLLSLGAADQEDLSDNDKVTVAVPFFGRRAVGNNRLSYLDISQESKGTRRVYSLAATWIMGVDHDAVIVVDELDQGLHPHLTEFLVRYINRPGRGGYQRAQLLATVNDAALLQNALDRNQVWFTQKRRDRSAILVPLSSYKPRKNESLMRGYLEGRYNAIPNIADPDRLG